jgi:hypothetical protein
MSKQPEVEDKSYVCGWTGPLKWTDILCSFIPFGTKPRSVQRKEYRLEYSASPWFLLHHTFLIVLQIKNEGLWLCGI